MAVGAGAEASVMLGATGGGGAGVELDAAVNVLDTGCDEPDGAGGVEATGLWTGVVGAGRVAVVVTGTASFSCFFSCGFRVNATGPAGFSAGAGSGGAADSFAGGGAGCNSASGTSGRDSGAGAGLAGRASLMEGAISTSVDGKRGALATGNASRASTTAAGTGDGVASGTGELAGTGGGETGGITIASEAGSGDVTADASAGRVGLGGVDSFAGSGFSLAGPFTLARTAKKFPAENFGPNFGPAAWGDAARPVNATLGGVTARLLAANMSPVSEAM